MALMDPFDSATCSNTRRTPMFKYRVSIHVAERGKYRKSKYITIRAQFNSCIKSFTWSWHMHIKFLFKKKKHITSNKNVWKFRCDISSFPVETWMPSRHFCLCLLLLWLSGCILSWLCFKTRVTPQVQTIGKVARWTRLQKAWDMGNQMQN